MVRRKRSMKINRLIYFRIGLRGHTPADELKGNCASYVEKEDERVHLWACTQVVVVTGSSLWLEEREAWRSTGRFIFR